MNVKIFIPLDQHTFSNSKQIYCLLNHFRGFSYVSTSTHNSMVRVYFDAAGHLFYHRYTIKVNQMGSTSETTVSNVMHHGDLIQVSLNSTPVGWKIFPRPTPNARPALKAANLSSGFCLPFCSPCREPGYLSQYRVWLRIGRPGDQGSIPGRRRLFL
jgi:hypothetical protein